MEAKNVANQDIIAQLQSKVDDNPGLAEALLALLKVTGDDPGQLLDVTLPVLLAAKANLPINIEDLLRQQFVIKYEIKLLGDSQVAIILPSGISRIAFLKEAQDLSYDLYGRHSPAVQRELISEWKTNLAFTKKLEESVVLAVDLRVLNSNDMHARDMVDKGRLDVAVEDLAVAHVAYYILTGEDAFKGKIVRGKLLPRASPLCLEVAG